MDYTNIEISEIKKRLRGCLSDERYRHSVGTMLAARDLAVRFGLDTKKAELAGLLHDAAKCMPIEFQNAIFNEHRQEFSEYEVLHPKTMHAPIGAFVAKTEFGIDDEEILSAIKLHTMGKEDMSDFEKIIFIADKIELETRKQINRQKVLAAIDQYGLDGGMLVCFKLTIKSLLKRNLEISKETVDTYNHFLASVKGVD